MLRPSVGGAGWRGYIPLMCLSIGSTIGGLVLGLASLGIHLVLGGSPARIGLVLGIGGLAAVATASHRVRRWIPERHCQVARTLLQTRSRERTSLRWGIKLGVGVTTLVVTPAFYALLAVSIAQRATVALLSCLTYGFVRGGTIATCAIWKDGRQRRGHGEPAGGRLKRMMTAPLAVNSAAATILVSITSMN